MEHQDRPYSVLPVKIVLVYQYLRLGIGVLLIKIGAKVIYISFNIVKSKGQDAIFTLAILPTPHPGSSHFI